MEERKHGNKFSKAERLHHENLIEGLFAGGTAMYDFPLRLTWRLLGRDELEKSFRMGAPRGIAPMQMMVTVPKKKRRHAVDRVLMRRRIREAYRLNRDEIRQAVESLPDVGTLSLGFVYIHTENCDYALIEKKMKRLLSKLSRELQKEDTNEQDQ